MDVLLIAVVAIIVGTILWFRKIRHQQLRIQWLRTKKKECNQGLFRLESVF